MQQRQQMGGGGGILGLGADPARQAAGPTEAQQQAAAGFSIQSEDFPALGGGGAAGAGGPPGAGGGGVATRGGFQLLAEQQGDYDPMLRYQQQQRAADATMAALGGKAGPGGGAILGGGPPGLLGGASGASPNSLLDRHGLLALMPLLRMHDTDAATLSLGTDLTALGLNLNATESLHRFLLSPLSDTPLEGSSGMTPASAAHLFDPSELPGCYKHTPQRLQPGYLTKFKEETLFYVFYSAPMDEAQLVAADELYARGWLWHRRVKLWMIASPTAPAAVKTPRGEVGSYLVFDPAVWEVVPKGPDVEISYEDLEPAPRLPRHKS